jgi:DNA invertase Pin-like site-specific DNA recombinase
MAKVRIVDDARTAGEPVTGIYLRVTQEESLKTDLSIPNQRNRGLEDAESHDWGTVKIYQEPKHVGADEGPEKRPALAEILRDIEAGVTTRVWARHTDRLWRGSEVQDLILKVMHRRSVELWDTAGQREFKSASGRFALKVLGAASELEKNLTGERIREMKRGKAKAGKVGGGPPPYGYTSQSRLILEGLRDGLRDEDAYRAACERYPLAKTWYVDEKEAEVVRLIFRLYLEERIGARRISEELNRRGHRRRGGSKWSPVKVGKIINNPALAGCTTYDEDAYHRGLPSKKARFRQTLFAGAHTAIIPLETWHEAQRLKIDVNSTRVRTKGTPNARIYPLSGVLRCSVCGSPMTGKSSGNRENAYYICSRRKYYGPRDGCPGETILQNWAELTVWKYLDPLLSGPALMAELLERTRRRVRRDEPSLQTKLDTLRAKASEIETRQRRWLEKFEETTDNASADIIWNRIRELKSAHSALLNDIQTTERQVAASTHPEVTEGDVVKLLARLASGDGSPEKRRILAQRLEQHHGLRVNMLDTRRLALSLRIDPFATSQPASEIGSRLVLVGKKDPSHKRRSRPVSSGLPVPGGPARSKL